MFQVVMNEFFSFNIESVKVRYQENYKKSIGDFILKEWLIKIRKTIVVMVLPTSEIFIGWRTTFPMQLQW